MTSPLELFLRGWRLSLASRLWSHLLGGGGSHRQGNVSALPRKPGGFGRLLAATQLYHLSLSNCLSIIRVSWEARDVQGFGEDRSLSRPEIKTSGILRTAPGQRWNLTSSSGVCCHAVAIAVNDQGPGGSPGLAALLQKALATLGPPRVTHHLPDQ